MKIIICIIDKKIKKIWLDVVQYKDGIKLSRPKSPPSKIKNTGRLIKKRKGKVVFVYFYYYDHSSYTLYPKNELKNICLEFKSFQEEAVLIERDYPGFHLEAEDASGGGEYRLEIYCDDDQSFEGTVANKENLIEEFSDYLTDKGVIKTKGEEKSR